jgi:hypothetical protein
MKESYNFRSRYTTGGLMAAGAVMVGDELFIHHAVDNGDGGVLWNFSRCGNRWRLEGMGRARYTFNRKALTVFNIVL